MPKGLEIHIEEPKYFGHWGTFRYGPKMPSGQWWLTSEPRVLFKIDSIAVLECSADENVEGDDGIVAHRDYCSRHFLIGQRTDGEVVWWHNLIAEYDLENKKSVEGSITHKEKQVIVKGYGGHGPHQGKTISIDVETGVKSVI